MLLSANASSERRFTLNNLIHPINALVVLLQTRNLAPEKVDFPVKVFCADLEIVTFVHQLRIFILVAREMPFLVFNIATEVRTFPVPEVDLVPIV